MNIKQSKPPWQGSPQGLFALAAMIVSGRGGHGGGATIDQIVDEMNRRVAAIMLAEAKNDIVPRFNQPKTVACVRAEFRVHEDIPGELKQGLFSQPSTYPAMLRFANATKMDDSKRDIRGLSIKVSNVKGPVLRGAPGIQDFILNSYPALFVATPEDFLSFIRARQEDKKLRFFLNPPDPHLKSLWIVIRASKKHLSPLDIRYWSTVPFRLGETGNQVVKYAVTPCSGYKTTRAVDAGENQLRAAIKAHLKQGPARFHFGVQRQADPKTMPIEDASVIWDEKASPFQTVATITIEDQAFDSPESLAACERSSFNPWQCLAAHAPLGRMNEVRRRVYEHAARLRNKE
ncbi:catalase family protein [Desulfococcus sp.]|uniref:catalase family protein n=1 Tax=Desulfococcus sp. TaxID=2025834 RepID=UPI003592FFDC